MQSILYSIGFILTIAYYIAAIYYGGGAIDFYTGSRSMIVHGLCWAVILFGMSFFPIDWILLGMLGYYLIEVKDWSPLLTFAFLFPGIVITLLSMITTGIGSLFGRKW